jgi:hypothetical protein
MTTYRHFLEAATSWRASGAQRSGARNPQIKVEKTRSEALKLAGFS